MIKGFKSKYYLLFIIPSAFLFYIIAIILNCPHNLIYAQSSNNNSLSTYQNSTYGITIKYPPDWNVVESSAIKGTDIDIATFISPNQIDNAIVDIYKDKKDIIDKDTSTYLNSTISLYKNDLKDFKIIESSTNNLLAGSNVAYKLIYTYTTGDGFKMKDFETGAIIENKKYRIVYDGKESVFDSYLPLVQDMINTFKISSTDN